MRLNLETEESSNMEQKQHHLPTIVLDAHGKATTNQQKSGCAPLAWFMYVQCQRVCDVTGDLESLQRFALRSSTLSKQVTKCSRE